MQWMTSSALCVTLCSRRSPQYGAEARLHVCFISGKFIRTIRRNPDFTRWGRHAHGDTGDQGPQPLTWFRPPVEAVYRGAAAARATATWSHR